jgi:hypothetical protein
MKQLVAGVACIRGVGGVNGAAITARSAVSVEAASVCTRRCTAVLIAVPSVAAGVAMLRRLLPVPCSCTSAVAVVVASVSTAFKSEKFFSFSLQLFFLFEVVRTNLMTRNAQNVIKKCALIICL